MRSPRVERATRDAERRCCALCDEQKWKRVKLAGPLDQLRILKAEGVLFLDKLVAHDDIIAARAAEPRGVPRVQDFAS